MTPQPWKAVQRHVELRVRLTPSGGRDAIDGVETDAEGQAYVKARVTAVPEDGKANKALIALLSKTLKISKSSISFVSGETSRKKILRLEGEPEDIVIKLQKL
ncbi:DUF167 domain-containing protein [Agrobacterium larrymoorei]|uniref:UPF0235 protein QE369_003742 n=1 Tax=Agrobacterium larrymoorei TaxID=160699 RepID=A0AAJ2BBT0_9HYPH|nr:DUF167 domain-containing protein [Agrobacterium larrymoorei]MDQ1187255.1 uncharacterized protein (TIGR00251 family) [Agrobacterium larrymoorei]MDR6103545.1 uncharacterized protein (TIGR00251 family) [Agrobacterium larrymoorei]